MNKSQQDMPELNATDIYPEWESLLGDSSKNSSNKNEENTLLMDDLINNDDESLWVRRFQKLNLPDMQLIALHLPPLPVVLNLPRQTASLRIARHHFLLKLVDLYKNDLKIAGFNDEDIQYLSMGVVPVNWTIHLKYPPKYGGKIETENMVLMPHHPFHEQIHLFLAQQMITDAGVITPKILYVPAPTRSIYIPLSSHTDSITLQHLTLGDSI